MLGPVRAWRGDHELELGGPRRRAVLAMLAARANQAVSRGEFIDGLWGQDPPPSAANSVHVYVAGLRGVLEPHRAHRAPGQVLTASGPGYLLRLPPGQVDLEALGHHLAQARGLTVSGDPAATARSLDAALELWKGTALAGIPGPWADIERVRLGELQQAVIEDRVELMLAMGGHHQAVAQLAGLIREHPLRERLRGQLMLALYRCGRQGDALEAFADTRRILGDELGIEPSPGLRRLHQQILTADTALDLPSDGGAGAGGGQARPVPPVPRQLPADVNAFTGRGSEMAALDRLLTAGAGESHQAGGRECGRPASMVISAVAGSGGVGKTTLAVHWAHRVRNEFPDGQMYVNLRGYDPAEPVTAADALAGFLRALGVADHDIPADVEERAARYRSLLDGRRMLVLLDNAAAVEQVRPLLPGTPSCAVVVTSRDSLSGLVARDGARRLDLDILPLGDAVALLRTLIGTRVDAEPAAAATLAGHCARLPLALRIAAELAAARPAVTLACLAGELADEQRRLDRLNAGGDPHTAVRTVFSWSYRSLPRDAARAFRLIGLHPGPDLDAYAAAALTGDTLERARDLLDLLARGHLVHPARPGRYTMHDLLRAYARHLTATQDAPAEDGAGGAEGQAALSRMFDYYLATAAGALGTAVPAERGRWSHIRQPVTPAPALSGPAAAQAWLDAEWDTLTAAAYAAARGWPGHIAHISTIMLRYLDVGGGSHSDAVTINTRTLQAASQIGDRAAEAYALNALGFLERQGCYPQAVSYFRQALAIFMETGDRFGAACALTNLGSADWRHGRYSQAAGHRRQALALFRQVGDQRGAARALKGIGLVDFRHGHYQQAGRHFEESLAMYRKLGDQSNEAQALGNLGLVDGKLGRYPQAAASLQHSLALFREIGDQYGAAVALTGLGSVTFWQGHHQEAIGYHVQALVLLCEIGQRTGQAPVLNGLGDILLAASHPDQARVRHAGALTLASQLGDRYEQARAHNGLASGYQVTGDPDQARNHWRQALACYTDLGLPEAADVRAYLTALDRRDLAATRTVPVGAPAPLTTCLC